MTKQNARTKTLTVILLTVALLLACSLFCFTPVTIAETEGDTAIVSSSAKDDYSEYTNNELPETINADNILQLVPAELFDSGELHVYCGSKYGFIIYSIGDINYVLLFIVNVSSESSTETYSCSLSIYYEGAFTYSAAYGAESVYSDRHLMLSNISLTETIVDISPNNILSPYYNQNTNDGAFFISCWQGDTQSTYYDIESLQELAGGFGQSLVISALNYYVPGLGTAFDMILKISSVINAADYVWQKTISKDTSEQYPASAQEQLESEITNHTLMKAVAFGNKEKVVDVLSYEGDGGTQQGDYVEFCTRTTNPNDIAYYLATAFNFDIGLYSTFGHGSDLGNYTASGAYSVKNGTTEYTEMTGNEIDGFDVNEKPFFAPLLKGKSFTFTPDSTGKYSLSAPDGYVCRLRNSSGAEVEPSYDGNYMLTAGQTYSVGICAYDEEVDWNAVSDDNYYADGEFIGEEAAFASVQVRRVQELPFAEDSTASGTVQNGISYARSTDGENNDLFKISASDVASLSVYITDEELNILSKGIAAEDGKSIYVNYPLTDKYYIIVVNSGSPIEVTVADTGELVLSERQYTFATGEGLYYKVRLDHTQYYDVAGECDGVYSAGGVKENGNNGTYWLSQGDYYLLSNDATQISIYYDPASMAEISAPDTVYTYTDNNADAIFRLFCDYIVPVQLSAPCDVYCNKELIAKNATIVLLEGGDTTNIYDFVVTDGSTSFSFTPYATEIEYNSIITVNGAETFAAYKFVLSDTTRIFADSQQNLVYCIYDEALNKINEDHGYLLEEGVYYIVVENGGNYSFEVKEKLIPIDITFVVDGSETEDVTGAVYYYGKMAELPVPQKDHYDFAGWQLPDGTMLTDSQGATLQPIYYDQVTLTAQWVVRKVELQVNMAEGSALWWTGNEFSETKVTVDFQTALFNDLVNLYNSYISLPEGNKPGHYFTQFTTEYISSEGNVDTYEFIPVWQVESYDIQFVFANGDMLSYDDIAYGTEISDSLFDSSVFDPEKRGYVFVNWRYGEDSYYDMGKGDRVPDFTPDVGVTDTIVVTLVAQFSLEEYTIFVNGQQIKVSCEDSYKIKTLTEYGISSSSYNGKNIYYIRSDNNATYYEGGVVEDVYSDISLSLKEQYASVNITYADCDMANNPVSMNLAQTHTLQAATKNTYEFDRWEYNGSTITVLSISSLGITGYLSNANPQFARTITAVWKSGYVSAGLGAHTLSYSSGNSSKLHVDCTTKLVSRTVTFNIASDVNEVTFHDSGRNWGDFAIYVQSRNTELKINFDGLTSIAGYANDCVIDARNCPSLVLNAMTDISIEAGEINSLTGNFDKAAILCNDLTLKGANFTIMGGEYVVNYLGTSKVTLASRGISEYNKSTLTISAKSVTVNGGNGSAGVDFEDSTAASGTEYTEKGSDGMPGGAGTNGACAIYWTGTINISSGSAVNFRGGNGGDGGNGGNGGKGGPGRNGSFGVPTEEPGDGGDGGDGGHGGNGATAVQGNPTINGAVTKINGTGGKPGEGGSGGKAGEEVETIWGNPKNGTDGISGKKGDDGSSGANDGL